MIRKFNIKKAGIIASLLAAVMLTGCRDDDLFSVNDAEKLPVEPSLVFDLNLTPFDDGSHSSTLEDHFKKHGEWYENYIDPGQIRVIFCDMDGYFLFEVDRRHIDVVSKDQSWSEGSLAYRVIISQSDLYPEYGREAGQNEAIRKAIEEDGFKVAVLANWPNLVEDERQRDPFTGDEMLGAESVPTELNFKWVPSDASEKPDNSHISWLSHCIFDNVYGVDARDDNNNPIYPYEQVVYYPNSKPGDLQNGQDPKTLRGQMGVFTTWVQYIYNNQTDAAKAIRQGMEGARSGVTFTYDCSGFQNWLNSKKTFNGDPSEVYSGDPEDFTYSTYSYDRRVDEQNEYSLNNIWRLWNFSAGQSCKYHRDCGNSVKAYWAARNQNVLVRELKNGKNWSSGSPTSGGSFTIKNHAGETLVESHNTGAKFKEYDGTEESGYIYTPQVLSQSDFDKIVKESPSKQMDLVQKFKEGALHFRAYGEGTLRIRAKKKKDASGDASKDGKIAVLALKDGFPAGSEDLVYITVREDGDEHSGKSTIPYFDPIDEGTSFTADEYRDGGEYIIDPGNFPFSHVYIGAIDNDVYIYEVEYMRARHIYDSARNAIMPSELDPIPMYGIQNFDPIPKELLQAKQTFNLSDKRQNLYLPDELRDKYNYKDIFLLRSVAKVEILFKKSVFAKNPPTHVMMRSMNRSARCEPKDVVNPTEWIWYGHNNLNTYLSTYVKDADPIVKVDDQAIPSTFPGVAEEFDNIMKYYSKKPLYEPNNKSLSEYRKRTAWFYGIWGEEGDPSYYWANAWTWNDGSDTPDKDGIEYPRIFNTRIDRSDFCRFHQMPDQDGYIRYIMYVPERNISDADSKGQLNASPKVQHIEVRFKNMNTTLNFDDNSHYRIYFTTYTDMNGKTAAADMLAGFNREGNPHTNNNTFDQGERNVELLKKLQPIMRNCYYTFKVESINKNELDVNLTVCTPASRYPSFTIQ